MTQQSSAEPSARRYPFLAGYALWFLPALWIDAGRRWRGVGFLYMLILMCVAWGAVGAKFYPTAKRLATQEIPTFVKDIPAIDVERGKLTTRLPRDPYVLKHPDNDAPSVVIDTTGATTTLPEGDAPSLLLTSHKVVFRIQHKTESHDFTPVKSFHLDTRRVQTWADRGLKLYWPVGVPVLIALGTVFRFALMLGYGLIGFVVARERHIPMSLAACMRLAALAMTPIILVDTALMLCGVTLGRAWTAAGVPLAIVLVVAMIRANRGPAQDLTPSVPK